MGCTASVAPKSRIQKTTSENVITHKQRMLIKKTWRYLACDMTAIGSKVFLNIFQLYPDIKELFPCRSKEGKELLQDENFKGHASRFMQAVGAVVDNMNNLDQSMTPLLIGLGRQHLNFNGFDPENFNAFTEAMTLAWEDELQGRFTAEVKAAWITVFKFIMDTLKEGYALAAAER